MSYIYVNVEYLNHQWIRNLHGVKTKFRPRWNVLDCFALVASSGLILGKTSVEFFGKVLEMCEENMIKNENYI